MKQKAAFPRPASEFSNLRSCPPQDGMTLREWYAGFAMLGFIVRGAWDDDHAIEAFKTADAMIKGREEYERRSRTGSTPTGDHKSGETQQSSG